MNRAAQRRTAPAGRRARLGRRSCRCGKPPRPDAKDHRRTGLSCTSPPRQRLRHGAAVSLRDDADRRTLPPQPVHCHDVVTAPHYPAQLLLGAQSLCTDETHSQDQRVVRPPARRGYRTRVRDHHRARGPDTLDASDAPSQGGPGAPWCAVTSVTGSQPRVRAGLVVVAGEGVTAQGSQRHNRLGRGPGTTTALAGTAVTSRIRHFRHFRHPLPGRGRRIRARGHGCHLTDPTHSTLSTPPPRERASDPRAHGQQRSEPAPRPSRRRGRERGGGGAEHVFDSRGWVVVAGYRGSPRRVLRPLAPCAGPVLSCRAGRGVRIVGRVGGGRVGAGGLFRGVWRALSPRARGIGRGGGASSSGTARL